MITRYNSKMNSNEALDMNPALQSKKNTFNQIHTADNLSDQ